MTPLWDLTLEWTAGTSASYIGLDWDQVVEEVARHNEVAQNIKTIIIRPSAK